MRVTDLSGQPLPPTLNTADLDFYTYRFINTDGKTTTTTVPEGLIIPKKIPENPDRVKSRRRRSDSLTKKKSEGDLLSPDGSEKPKKRSRKMAQSPSQTATTSLEQGK